jgi:hypothetical protein
MSLKLDMSQEMPRPAMETGMFCGVVRAWDSRWVGYVCCAVGIISSFHQPAVLVVEKSGEHEAEKPKSMLGESVGPHAVIGILRELGGVKVERAAALEVDEYVRPMLWLKGSLLFEVPMAGDACGVSW